METFKHLTKKFDWINSNIEKNFPLQEVAKDIEYKLFHFDQYISSEKAISEIKKEGYYPATFSHLLDWKDWDELQLVIALGSDGGVDGDRYVPALYRGGSKRNLGLCYLDGVWGAGCRFLGVRKLSLRQSDSKEISLDTLDSLSLDLPQVPETFHMLMRIEKKLDTLLTHFK